MRCNVTRSLCGTYWKVDVAGEPGSVLFSGGDDERRAREYARWKEGVVVRGLSLGGLSLASVYAMNYVPGTILPPTPPPTAIDRAPSEPPAPESWRDRPPLF